MYFIAWSTLLCGATSTALGYLAPPYSIVIISSLGAAFSIAFAKTSIGFLLSFFSILLNVSSTRSYAESAFPVFLPEEMTCFLALWPATISLFISLSTMNVFDLWNLLPAYLAPVLGTILGFSEM